MVYQMIVFGRSLDNSIAICQISSGHVSWQVQTPCWSQIIMSIKGSIQHLMSMYICLASDQQTFQSIVMINNFSQMCVYLTILQLKL